MRKSSIKKRIQLLENELIQLKSELQSDSEQPTTVVVPEAHEELFKEIEDKVNTYFDNIHNDPQSGEITVFGERYLLLRSASMSYEFVNFVKERYADREESEAISIGNNFLYDNAKVIGKKDALAFHERLNLKEPIEKLSAGPIHFAYTGWANVEISEGSNPTPDDDYVLKFIHHNSFEAQSWIKAKHKSKIPVCTMNCGYSAGWCEESFGLPMTTVEITCEAKGDDKCSFIMAPPHKIAQYVDEIIDMEPNTNIEIPVFFKRKYAEEKLKESIEQKEVLIREIHHRVKNNLQVITSLLRLQMDKVDDKFLREEFDASINRINIMASVHELVYQEKNLDHINMKSYFDDLVKLLVQLYSFDNSINIDININIGERDFNIENSIPLALMLNEITCNSFKHGLRKGGTFHLSLNEFGDYFELVISDDGGGFDESKTENGLGLSLIEILSDQLDAKLDVHNTKTGLTYRIKFSLSK